MKKHFKNILIVFLGTSFGFLFGYIIVFGINKTSFYTEEFVKNINFSRHKEITQGGPSLSDIFKENKSVYFLDYKKSYKINDNAPIPYLTAQNYLVGDLESGEIIFSKNKNKVLPIASISKLVTAITADEAIGLSKEVRVSNRAVSTYGEQGDLKVGEIYKINEIFYPLLLESSNDAAEVIAESIGRDVFMGKVNEKMREIKMYNSHFNDPSGLSPQNVSTVSDLFKLIQYIDKYRNYIFKITKTKRYKLGKKVWFNNSKFRSDGDYYGGKNGYTDIAQKTQIAIFNISFNGNVRKIAFIILKTDDIEGDIYGLKKYVEKYVTYD